MREPTKKMVVVVYAHEEDDPSAVAVFDDLEEAEQFCREAVASAVTSYNTEDGFGPEDPYFRASVEGFGVCAPGFLYPFEQWLIEGEIPVYERATTR